MSELKMPPSIARGYLPEEVRFMWYVITKDGTHHTGFTWAGIPNLLKRGGREIKELKVVDFKSGKVYKIRNVDFFMEDWADNYSDPNWDISQCQAAKRINKDL